MTVTDLPTSSLVVDPVNVRREAHGIEDLAASVAAQGILQPLVVRPLPDGTFGVVAGQRRLAAARHVDLDTVPCTVREMDDTAAALVSASENLSRDDLDPITEAETYRALLDTTGDTMRALARRIGVPESTMVKRLKLLGLPEDLRESLRAGDMSVTAAYAMVKKSQQARQDATPRKRPHAITDDDVEYLDVLAVAEDLVRAVKRHIAEHYPEPVTDFIARAVRRELAVPSCHEDRCWGDAIGGGRYCRRHFDLAARDRKRGAA